MQGNELAVEAWWAEMAKEQGTEWLNEQYQFAISGYALYGEIELNSGFPLAVNDYIVAGIQTDPNSEKTRCARVSGQLVPDKLGNKSIQYITQTYSGFDIVMGLSTDPFPESTFKQHELFCEDNFGPNPCNGINGVFGSDFKSATNSSPGLWRLWLWLPEQSHASYFEYNLKAGDEVAVWAGTYVNS